MLFQSAVSPLLVVEDCPVQEMRHADDDCSPLCVTCACSPIGHAFQHEIVNDGAAAGDPAAAAVLLTVAAPDAPPREILHVPLGTSAL